MNGNVVEFECNDGGVPAWFMELDGDDVLLSDACSDDITVSTSMVQENTECWQTGYMEKYTLTWTANDGCGNSSEMSIEAVVVDNVAPVVENMEDHLCVTDPIGLTIDFYDECGNAYADHFDEIIEMECGTATKRTWQVSDICGNVVEVEQLIMTDTIPPRLDFRDANMSGLPSGTNMVFECGQDIPLMDANSIFASDNCLAELEVEFVSENMATGDCASTGILSQMRYEWSATDPCGNHSVFELFVSLEDRTAPEIEGMDDDMVIECGVELPEVIATDACGNVETVITMDEVLGRDCDTIKTITRTLEATDDCGNQAKKTQIIYVVNYDGPSFAHNDAVLCEEFDREVTAFDECAGQFVTPTLVDENVLRDCGITERTYMAVDDCGNESFFTQTMISQDTVAPSIEIINEVLAEILQEGNETTVYMSQEGLLRAIYAFAKNDVYAIDDCGVDPFINFNKTTLPHAQCVNGEVELLKFQWDALDMCGNLTELELTVHVVDDVDPVIVNVPEDVDVICGDAPPAAVQATDNYSQVTLSFSQTIIPSNNPDNYTIVRTWTATDECGNSSSASQNVNITNDVGLSCDILVDDMTACNTHNNIAIGVATGGTGPYTYDWDIVAGQCLIESGADNDTMTFYVGFEEVTLTLTVTDANGCSSTCTYTFECQDKKNGIQSGQNGNDPNNLNNHVQITNAMIYPNPTVRDLNIQFESNVTNFGHMHITDALGRSVLSQKIAVLKGTNKYHVNTERYSNGIYFIRLNISDEVERTIKFVKAK